MPIQFDSFDQQKVDNIKTLLDSQVGKGKPKSYEIHVDGIKAVSRTEDPNDFYKYEDYMTDRTNSIKFILFGSNNSPRNEQYVYALKAKNPAEALEIGLNGFASKSYSNDEIKEMIAKRQKQSVDAEELELLRTKLTALNTDLEEKQKYIGQLEDGIEKAKANGNKIGGVHIGEIVSVALEGIVRRNAPLIAKIPGLEGLAGFMEQNNPTPSQQQPDSEFSFKRKDSPTSSPILTEQEKQFLALFNEIHRHFTEDEMAQIIEILESLAKDKTQIIPVVQLLQEGPDNVN